MIADAIDCFPSPITVRRTNAATTFVDGLAVVPTDVNEFCLDRVSVQPMSPRERMLLPELIRDRELIKLYTACNLQSVNVEGKIRADRLAYRGQNYVVQSVEDWENDGGFFKVVAVKEND